MLNGDFAEQLSALAERLALPIEPCQLVSQPLFLTVIDERLALLPSDSSHGPIVVDFAAGAAAHRRLHGGGAGQAIAKAVGVNSKFKPRVLDMTAGLGGDGFVLASLGCAVTLLERNPVVHALLDDGLRRAVAAEDTDLAVIAERMQLHPSSAAQFVANRPLYDLVYLDPMFPERKKKSAKARKEMAAFHLLVGEDGDADELLEHALECAEYRVVVKRPAHAPWLAGRKPSVERLGKSTRFDIYSKKKLPAGAV